MFRDRFLGGARRSQFVLFNSEGEGGGAPAPAPTQPQPAPEPHRPNGYSAEFVRDLREEAKAHRLKAKDLETQLESFASKLTQKEKDAEAAIAAAKADFDKTLSETRTAGEQRVIRAELKAEAIKAGMIDLDGLKLADLEKVKLNPETGEVEGAGDLLADLKKSKPYLFGAPKGTSNPEDPPKPGQTEAKHATKMNRDEYAAAKAAALRAR